MIRGRSEHHEQKGPSHTSTERPQLKFPVDWLTRTAIRLSTKWVWAKGWIYFRGLYGPRWGTCHPYLNTPGHQATRPSGRNSRQKSWVGWGSQVEGLSGPSYNPDQAEPTPSDNQGLWESGVDIFRQRSHIYRGRRMPMGVTSNWCHPQGHHAWRPSTTVPEWKTRITYI